MVNKKLLRREAAMRDLGLAESEIAQLLSPQSALTAPRDRETKTETTKTKTAKAGNVRKGKGGGRRKS